MWRKVQFIAGVLCIALYAGVAVWSGVCVYKAQRVQKEQAEKEFAGLAAFAEAAGASGFFGQRFQDDIEQTVFASRALQAVLLSGPEDRLIAVEKTPGVIRWVNDQPRYNRNVFLFSKPLVSALRVDGLRNVSLSAVASPVDYAALTGILRTALFAVLLSAGVSFSLLMLGFLPILNRKKSEEAAGESEYEDEAATDDDEALPEEADAPEEEAEGSHDAGGVAIKAGAEEPPPVPEAAASEEAGGEAEAPAPSEEDAPDYAAEASAPPEEDAPDYAAVDVFEEALFAGADAEEQPEAFAALAEDAAATALEEGAAESFLREPPPFDDLDQAFKESFPPEDPLAPFLEEAQPEAPPDKPEEPPAPSSAPEEAAAPEGALPEDALPEDAPPAPVEPGPALPLYEGFGDELSEAYPRARRGLLAAASRIYEKDIMAEDKESAAFMEALGGALESAGNEAADLCLLAAEWREGEKSAESLEEEARGFFKQDDQIFARAAGGIYVIIPDSALDGAFVLAKEFYARAAGGQSEDDLLTIGLSTKAGRRVDAERLLKEARKALSKAREDDELPIVAFKVDAEKYNRLYAGSV